MTHHFEIDAYWPDGHVQVCVRFALNWRHVRALLREQAKERPTCTFKVRRTVPRPRWEVRSFSYADIRNFDRNESRRRNGHPTK